MTAGGGAFHRTKSSNTKCLKANSAAHSSTAEPFDSKLSINLTCIPGYCPRGNPLLGSHERTCFLSSQQSLTAQLTGRCPFSFSSVAFCFSVFSWSRTDTWTETLMTFVGRAAAVSPKQFWFVSRGTKTSWCLTFVQNAPRVVASHFLLTRQCRLIFTTTAAHQWRSQAA